MRGDRLGGTRCEGQQQQLKLKLLTQPFQGAVRASCDFLPLTPCLLDFRRPQQTPWHGMHAGGSPRHFRTSLPWGRYPPSNWVMQTLTDLSLEPLALGELLEGGPRLGLGRSEGSCWPGSDRGGVWCTQQQDRCTRWPSGLQPGVAVEQQHQISPPQTNNTTTANMLLVGLHLSPTQCICPSSLPLVPK